MESDGHGEPALLDDALFNLNVPDDEDDDIEDEVFDEEEWGLMSTHGGAAVLPGAGEPSDVAAGPATPLQAEVERTSVPMGAPAEDGTVSSESWSDDVEDEVEEDEDDG